MKTIGIVLLVLSICISSFATTYEDGAYVFRGPVTVQGDFTVATPYNSYFDTITLGTDGTRMGGGFTVYGNLNVSGFTTLSNTTYITDLYVSSSSGAGGYYLIGSHISNTYSYVSINDSMTVADDIYAGDDIRLDGSGAIYDTLDDVDINDTLTVSGASTFSSTLSAAGITTTTLAATGNITDPNDDVDIADTLTVSGAATFSSTLSAQGLTTTTLTATGNITDSVDDIDLADSVTISDNLFLAGYIQDTTDDVDINDTLTVSGTTTFSSTLDAQGITTTTLTTTGNITDSTDDIDINDSATIANDIYAGEDIFLVGYLQDTIDDIDINDSCTIADVLTVSGASILAATSFSGNITSIVDDVDVADSMSISDILYADGGIKDSVDDVDIDDTLTVSDAATFSSTLSAAGITTTTFGVTGDITDSVDDVDINDTCTISGKLTGSAGIYGSLQYNVTALALTTTDADTDITATIATHVYTVDTTDSATRITLPDANTMLGKHYIFILETDGGKNLEVKTDGTDTLDGTNMLGTFADAGDALEIIAISANRWFIMTNIGSVVLSAL